jgi:hypothetical protein
MAGASNDQKLAATITPPVNPSIPSRVRRDTSPKNTTSPAPALVSSQVPIVAMSAASAGCRPAKKSMIAFMPSTLEMR